MRQDQTHEASIRDARPERPSSGGWIHDVLPFDRDLPAALIDLVIRPGRAVAAWRVDRARASVTPMQLYLAAAAIGFAVTGVLGEANTGALYVFGGGVFGKIERAGAWLALLLVVPVFAAWLRIAYSGRPFTFRDHTIFALHLGATIFIGIAAESVVLAMLGGDSPVRAVASGVFLWLALLWYLVAQREAYDAPIPDAVIRGLLALLGYLLVFAGAVLVLAQTTDFRL